MQAIGTSGSRKRIAAIPSRVPPHAEQGILRHFVTLWLLICLLSGCHRDPNPEPQGLPEALFTLMHAGKNHLEQGNASEALDVYQQAASLVPNHPDVHLNLAIAHLLHDAPDAAIQESDRVLSFEPNAAAAYFVKGSAHLRLMQPEEAVKALENARSIDPGVASTFFQLGLARMGLEQWEEAITALRAGIQLEPNRLHSSAHYLLAQSLIRVGRKEEAEQELQLHQGMAQGDGPSMGAAVFERCVHTRARVPFKLDQPATEGIAVTFSDATQETLGSLASEFSGPVAVVRGMDKLWNSLMVVDPNVGLKRLDFSQGKWLLSDQMFPGWDAIEPKKMLVGDFQNDRWNDLIVLGTKGSRVYQGTEEGAFMDVTFGSGLETLSAGDGLLIDLDFTGKLDLIAVNSADGKLKVFRQSSNLKFQDISQAAGIPDSLNATSRLFMSDWNRDQVTDLILARTSKAPLLLEKQRGGVLVHKEPVDWKPGTAFCVADFDNDLRPDLITLNQTGITLSTHDGEQTQLSTEPASAIGHLIAIDYDNDGWLDLWGIGPGLRAWRNQGLKGFREITRDLGLDALAAWEVEDIRFGDFDQDCDPDALLTLSGGGLRFLRNNGGNTHQQIKVEMVGNRSNAIGIGCKIEVETGGLRLIRTVRQLPVEIGVGNHQQLDSFLVHWFNWPQGSAQLPVDCREPLLALELTIQEGSCPYLYAWNGEQFQFITDFLGASPLGLPIAPGTYIEADTEEWLWVGNEKTLIEKDGFLQLSITEELREVLYLDEAKLAVVDRDPHTEVHPTDKLLPAAPFPKGTLMTLHREHRLQHATGQDGREVTEALRKVDGLRASPPALRTPQLRGLAETHHWILDFGPLDSERPLVLVMEGWLRFGGGMANVAASMDPSLPFPFPRLEAETSAGHWTPVEVTVGAPAGKTKTILVDLDGALPEGTRRLRLTGAFEIHWDRIALLEKVTDADSRITMIEPSRADLRFRGWSTLMDLPPDWPATPDYHRAQPHAHWTLIPGGWCTRYGDVRELIASQDEGLLVMNSGDELALKFSIDALPPRPKHTVREYFLYVDGWDKDSDFHVAHGDRVEPLPHHGMEYQRYGKEKRPSFPSDTLHRTYNTRWVEGVNFHQVTANQPGQATVPGNP